VKRAASLMLLPLVVACGNPDDEPAACATSSERMLVTADWLNRSLSLFDAAALTDTACDVEDAMIDTIDLAEYAPGPLQLELTPQGEAVVAVGPGFLAGTFVSADRVEAGGSVLVVDLDARSVVHEIAVPHAPMGLAITPDGRYALSANYGEVDIVGNTLTLIDLDAGVVLSSIEVGERPEQVALDAEGAGGLVNSAAGNVVRGFSFASETITLSDAIDIGDDPSDVSFISRERGVATSSLGISYSLIDTSDVTAPTLVDTFGSTSGIPYGVTTIDGSTEVLVTTFLAEASLLHVDLAGDTNEVLAEILLPGSPLTLVAVHDPVSGFAFVPQPGDQQLSIVDLATQTTRQITWLSDAGPTYVALRP
jgi:DNA-binding beta-propeller fold protein YncE